MKAKSDATEIVSDFSDRDHAFVASRRHRAHRNGQE